MSFLRLPRRAVSTAVCLVFLGALTVEATAGSPFTVSSSRAGAFRVDVNLTKAWAVPLEGIAYTGRGTVSLLIKHAADRSFAATATRWAPLAGEPSLGSTVEMSHLSQTWGLAAGRYTFTLYCDAACGVTFPTRPKGLAGRLNPKAAARNVTSWRQHLDVAAPGGVAVHAVGDGDLRGIALASTGVTSGRELAGVEASDVCRVSQAPLCDRQEDGWSRDYASESDRSGATKSVSRFTRVYSDVSGSESTVHRLLVSGGVDADATLLFFPR